MKVALIGADGQLGHDLLERYIEAGHDVTPLTHSQVEITDPTSVHAVMSKLLPNLIVNTAAMHNVDACETDPGRALLVNGFGALTVARAARRWEATLVHISTDYVFDGKSDAPYRENDPTAPLNCYGTSKLAGECFVRATLDRHVIVRTSALYGASPCRAKGGMNFVQRMLSYAKSGAPLKVVTDEIVTPTYTCDLARQIVHLSASGAYGLFHATAHGQCSWHEFAVEILRTAGIDVAVDRSVASDVPTKTPRPRYSVLENQRLEDAGLDVMRPWQEGLRDYLSAVA